MTGGITLWKDRGYKVEVPRTLTPEQRDRYGAPPPAAGDRPRGPGAAARGQGAAARRRRPRLPDRALPRRRRRRDARHRRRRRRRRVQPAAPDHPHDRPHRDAEGRLGRGGDRGAQPGREGGQVPRSGWTPRTSWRSSRATTSSSTAWTTSPRATCSTTRRSASGSRSSPPPSSASTASCRCSSRTTARATAASTPSRRRPSWRPSCGANGVLGVLPGTMGLLQATEVVKLVTGAGEPLVGRLLLYEALGATFTELKVRRDPECPICSRPRRRSRTRRWACSPTTRRSAPPRARLPRDGHDQDPTRPALLRGRREGGDGGRRRRRRRPALARGAASGHRVPALRRRTARSTAT